MAAVVERFFDQLQRMLEARAAGYRSRAKHSVEIGTQHASFCTDEGWAKVSVRRSQRGLGWRLTVADTEEALHTDEGVIAEIGDWMRGRLTAEGRQIRLSDGHWLRSWQERLGLERIDMDRDASALCVRWVAAPPDPEQLLILAAALERQWRTAEPAPAPGPSVEAPEPHAIPGVGLLDITIGESTAEDVLDRFGRDGEIRLRNAEGQVRCISYDFDPNGRYLPSRDANRRRPYSLWFEAGVVTSLHFGVYQRDIATPGGVKTYAPRSVVLSELGDAYELSQISELDAYRYPAHGIEVWIDPETDQVNSFFIFARLE